MVLFSSVFSKRASKYIQKLDKIIQNRINEKIEKLEQDPFPQEVERVEDFEGEKVFRVRVGNQRILYIVRYNPNKLIIVKIDKRPRVYNRWFPWNFEFDCAINTIQNEQEYKN